MCKTCIEVKNITVKYDKAAVIEDMSLSIPKGKITMIIGANGCGKSTLLKAISRIIPISNGEIYIAGKEVRKHASKQLAKEMAILPQNPTTPSGLKVKELVAYGRFPYQSPMGGLKKEDIEKIEWAMEVTGISQLQDREVEALSGGQKQRVWIALTLAQDTPILVLDEPTTYLDMSHQLEILELLQKLNLENQISIVMVLHELNNASKFANHLIGMKNGKIIFAGAPKDVITKENLLHIYGIHAALQYDVTNSYPICVDFSLSK